MNAVPRVRVGTSAFTAAGWRGSFYPSGLKPARYLSYYAQHFDTVEIDSTYYGPPSAQTVRNWASQTPDDFLFSAKFPQVITHDRCLEGCDTEFAEFLTVMELLGQKLGVLLFQFPFFNRQRFSSVDSFLRRLEPFFKRLPKGFRFALELRNKDWVTSQFLEVLRAYGVTYAFIDHPLMPTAMEYLEGKDAITSAIGYIRMLGDRYAIEEKTRTWDSTIIDRSGEFRDWTTACEKLTKRGLEVLVYINNHYAGHAPASVREFVASLKHSGVAFQSVAAPQQQLFR